jgi:predicted RNA binding protein YcfA (HicA-like mRNA interferase family)/predicted RNase H-like HicB family nuclease
VRLVPMKVSEIIRPLGADGWTLTRTTGSHRQYTHPTKPRPATVAGKPGATLKKTEATILKQAGLRREAAMSGCVIVFEGDDPSGYSAHSPDLLGVLAAGDTRSETERLMREAIAEHVALLRQTGQPVPEPSDAAAVAILEVPAA